MTVTRPLAITALTDITTWLRGRRITERMDDASTDVDAVVERRYGYGDPAHISAVGFEGATGTIEEVALRTTRLRTLTGDVVTVANGLIVGGHQPVPRLGPGRPGPRRPPRPRWNHDQRHQQDAAHPGRDR